MERIYHYGQNIEFYLDHTHYGKGTVINDFGINGVLIMLMYDCNDFPAFEEIIITKSEIC